MSVAEILALLDEAPDSLHLGLRIARSQVRPREQVGLLLDILGRFGQRCSAATARELEYVATDLHAGHPEHAEALAVALAENTRPAARYLRALLLEASGQHAEAAEALQAIPDGAWGEDRAVRLLACSRNLALAGAHSEAWRTLGEAARAAGSYRTLCAVDRLAGRLGRAGPGPHRRRCRVALVGSTSLDLLVPALRAGCLAAGIEAEVWQGAFGQYQQDILAPASGLAASAPDVVIIATDWRALALPDETDDPARVAREQVSGLRDLWRRCRDGLGAFVIQHNFEIPLADPYGRLSAVLQGGRGRLLRRINLELWDAEQQEAGVAVLDVEQAASGYGKGAWVNPALWYAARQYPAPEALPWLVRRQVALLRAALGLSAKGLVVDLDGTLWGGVIGEDGLPGIVLGGSPVGEAFVAFQRYLQSLVRRGIILAVCTKNNEEDAWLPFRQHPDMALALDDITAFVANWRPKDENLRLIAESVNIGLDTLVFVDDSPAERAWLRRQVPEVEVPEMPADPALYIDALDQGMHFEALTLTDDDRHRAEAYRGNLQRQALQAASLTIEQFLAELRMQVELRPCDEANLPRIAQLVNKTNQFNLTTRRLSESQLRALIGRPGCYTQSTRLWDRFGDNGLTGALVALPEEGGLRIDIWLLSCRVLGRQVEQVMLAGLARHALSQGMRYLVGEYLPTARNGLVRDLYDRLGFELCQEAPDGSRRYRLDLARGAPAAPGYIEVRDHTGPAGDILPTAGWPDRRTCSPTPETAGTTNGSTDR